MKKVIVISVALLSLVACSNKTDVRKVAEAVIDNAPAHLDYVHYTGSVFTQSLAEFVVQTGSRKYRAMAEGIIDDFIAGKGEERGSFISYYTGGPLVPEMVRAGYSKAAPMAAATAERMWKEQNRNRDGLMIPFWSDLAPKNGMFVDCVLAVSTYFLYEGLNEGNVEYMDFAAWTALKTYEDLYDPESGLVNQARAVRWMAEGQVTEDCWSRGNGWLSMGLAALLRDLPKDNKYRADIERVSADFYTAVLKWQGPDGLWHQEMTWHDSYPELSGSGLLLCGLGRAIEAGVIDRDTALPAFRIGIEALLRYVDADGNTGNTCSGCLAWGDGTKAAYASHSYFYNEVHSFGPVVFALTEALALGIKKVDTELGAGLEGKVPACHVRQITERKNDLAWENDRAAFRIYSTTANGKVSSGVDYWAKKCDWPVVENWYASGDYHTDRGEGCDFYTVGRRRGLGGIGIWTGDKLLVPDPYSGYKVLKESPQCISFELSYPDIKDGDVTYSLSEEIEMILGTNFYRKRITLSQPEDSNALIAVGLSGFGNAEVTREGNVLSVIEALEPKGKEDKGAEGVVLASAIVAEPALFAGFASEGDDSLILLKPLSEGSICFVGVAWNKDNRIGDPWKKWPAILKANTFESLNNQYSSL